MNLVRAAATVGSLTMVSRVLGFLRDAMIAATLGAGILADAFFVAFKLANLLRRLFAEGAFNAAFVPLFARTFEGDGKEEARRFAEEALAVLASVLLIVVLLAEIGMPLLVRVLASGFEPESARFLLAVELSRITFPYLALISLAALFSGMLNALGHFWVAAFAPIILNLVLISSLLLASLHPATPAHALAWGVSIAGVLQLGLVAWATARHGFAPRLQRPRLTPRVRRLNRLILPGVFGAGVYQLNLVVDTWFASHLPAGAVSYLFYADRLNQLPLGLVGVALGTVLLPILARQIRAGQVATALHSQNRALEIGLFLTLPATVALIVLAEPIIQLLFERGAFDRSATVATAGALAALAVGLPAYVLIKVLVPAFFAREDTRTPVLVAGVALLSNIVIINLLIDRYAHVGIALATAIANWLNALLLGFFLHRRGYLQLDTRLISRLPRMLLASAAMAMCLWLLPRALTDMPLGASLPIACVVGGALFLLMAEMTGAASFRELRAQLSVRRA